MLAYMHEGLSDLCCPDPWILIEMIIKSMYTILAAKYIICGYLTLSAPVCYAARPVRWKIGLERRRDCVDARFRLHNKEST